MHLDVGCEHSLKSCQTMMMIFSRQRMLLTLMLLLVALKIASRSERHANMSALPEENDMKWPQENQHYFAGKKNIVAYVRTD